MREPRPRSALGRAAALRVIPAVATGYPACDELRRSNESTSRIYDSLEVASGESFYAAIACPTGMDASPKQGVAAMLAGAPFAVPFPIADDSSRSRHDGAARTETDLLHGGG